MLCKCRPNKPCREHEILEDLAHISRMRDLEMLKARDDYFENINWNVERLRRMHIPIEKNINLDMFYELSEAR